MLSKAKAKPSARGPNKSHVVKSPVKMPCYFLSYRYKHNFELPTVTKVALNFSYVYRAKIARMLDIIHMQISSHLMLKSKNFHVG